MRTAPHTSPPPEPRRPPASARARWLPLALTAALTACSGAPPALPARPPERVARWAHGAPAAPDRAAPDPLRDRAALRAGFACADCHRIGADDAALRGGPDLPPMGLDAAAHPAPDAWAPAVARCLERYGATPGDDPEHLARLLAALRALPAAKVAPAEVAAAEPQRGGAAGPTAGPSDPRALWRQACAHCHDTGPGPDLHRRPWPAPRLVAAVRGTDRPRHPAGQMPAFSAARITDDRLADLARALEAGALAPRPPPDAHHAPTPHPEVGNGEGQ